MQRWETLWTLHFASEFVKIVKDDVKFCFFYFLASIVSNFDIPMHHLTKWHSLTLEDNSKFKLKNIYYAIIYIVMSSCPYLLKNEFPVIQLGGEDLLINDLGKNPYKKIK